LNAMDPNEPSVCINPQNTDEILVGANSNNYYFSRDGGLTWKHGVLQSSYGVYCDPAIVCDDQGSFYFFHLVPDLSRVVCQKRTSDAITWSDGSFTALNGTMQIDKEWACFDPVNGNLYTTWSQFNRHGSTDPRDSTIIFLSRSEDRGLTWSEKIRISNKGGNASGGFQSVHGSYPATGPNGEVYVCWWSPAGLMFDKSTDEGKTWLTADIRVTSPVQWIYLVPGMQLTPTFPVISCDRSNGRYRGVIYINWSDNRNGANDSDIWVVKSMDGGNSWSIPKRVNDDPVGKQQYFNFLSIDQVAGYVYIAYYDRRNYSDNRTDVYLAVSRDGCTSFENMKISDTPFLPYNTAFFGHYLGISAHDNKVFAAWSRQDNGVNSLWGSIVDTGSSGTESLTKGPLTLEQNSPNPFNEYTFFSFKLSDPGPVTLLVNDLYGRTVAAVVDNEQMSAGKHTIHFSPDQYNLAPGVYYYTLITRDQTAARKMIYGR
ncbi:MAG: T9SS type A sorting domain-containing protein, partial [Bacteroidia bacterium]|nr:T9SS type A sorting domain-containing protein [Bacteroidia bacterium]